MSDEQFKQIMDKLRDLELLLRGQDPAVARWNEAAEKSRTATPQRQD